MDSYAVAKNCTERSHVSFTQFPSIVHSCKTVVQYHNQDIDIDTVKI